MDVIFCLPHQRMYLRTEAGHEHVFLEHLMLLPILIHHHPDMRLIVCVLLFLYSLLEVEAVLRPRHLGLGLFTEPAHGSRLGSLSKRSSPRDSQSSAPGGSSRQSRGARSPDSSRDLHGRPESRLSNFLSWTSRGRFRERQSPIDCLRQYTARNRERRLRRSQDAARGSIWSRNPFKRSPAGQEGLQSEHMPPDSRRSSSQLEYTFAELPRLSPQGGRQLSRDSLGKDDDDTSIRLPLRQSLEAELSHQRREPQSFELADSNKDSTKAREKQDSASQAPASTGHSRQFGADHHQPQADSRHTTVPRYSLVDSRHIQADDLGPSLPLRSPLENLFIRGLRHPDPRAEIQRDSPNSLARIMEVPRPSNPLPPTPFSREQSQQYRVFSSGPGSPRYSFPTTPLDRTPQASQPQTPHRSQASGSTFDSQVGRNLYWRPLPQLALVGSNNPALRARRLRQVATETYTPPSMRLHADLGRSISYRPVPPNLQPADHRHPALQGQRQPGIITEASETTGTSPGEAQTPTHPSNTHTPPFGSRPARLSFPLVSRQRGPLAEWAIARGGLGEFTHQDFRDLMTGESSRIGVGGGPRTWTDRGGGGGGVTTDQGSRSRSRQWSQSRTEQDEGEGSVLPSIPNTPPGASGRQGRPSWESSPERRPPKESREGHWTNS